MRAPDTKSYPVKFLNGHAPPAKRSLSGVRADRKLLAFAQEGTRHVQAGLGWLLNIGDPEGSAVAEPSCSFSTRSSLKNHNPLPMESRKLGLVACAWLALEEPTALCLQLGQLLTSSWIAKMVFAAAGAGAGMVIASKHPAYNVGFFPWAIVVVSFICGWLITVPMGKAALLFSWMIAFVFSWSLLPDCLTLPLE